MNALVFLSATLTSLCYARHTPSENLFDLIGGHVLPGFLDALVPTNELIDEVPDIYSSSTYAWDFLQLTNNELRQQTRMLTLASWAYLTNITEENMRKKTEATTRFNAWFKRRRAEAQRFNMDALPEFYRRQLYELTLSASPSNATEESRIIQLGSSMTAIYSSGRACVNGTSCLTLEPDLINIMSRSRDPEQLKAVWVKWRDAVGPTIKPLYTEFIELHNRGARENGYSDYSDFWKENLFRDTPGLEDMAHELWTSIKPLYEQLHAYIRRKLRERYGSGVVGYWGSIPAHLLGNMWAQHWTNIMDIARPYSDVDQQSRIESRLQASGIGVHGMFRLAEDFYKSLGLFPMTPTFWEKSMFTRPSDREVACHASASDMFYPGDFRIRMCAEVTFPSLKTIYHEMGHITYYMAYADQMTLFRKGANAAFHESIGDTIQLAMLSESNLRHLGLLGRTIERNAEDDEEEEEIDETMEASDSSYKTDLENLMSLALEKLAFLPFGYLVDKWRWRVMRGDITPDNYNRKWWEIRMEYQGVHAPVTRTEQDFDPGAKYHIPSHSAYISYFFSYIQQFQMYKALCEESGHTGPLHQCNFYNSKAAGRKFRKMLRQGSSTPWQRQLRQLTGSSRVTADAIWEYFQPLYDWLVADNHKHREPIGWEGSEINWD